MGVKLASIEIKNFRSIFARRDGGEAVSGALQLELSEGMNAFVAPNNVGKSNVLRALALAMGEEDGEAFSKARDWPHPLTWAVPSITLGFRVEPPVSGPERTLLSLARRYEQTVEGARGHTYAERGERGIVRLRDRARRVR